MVVFAPRTASGTHRRLSMELKISSSRDYSSLRRLDGKIETRNNLIQGLDSLGPVHIPGGPPIMQDDDRTWNGLADHPVHDFFGSRKVRIPGVDVTHDGSVAQSFDNIKHPFRKKSDGRGLKYRGCVPSMLLRSSSVRQISSLTCLFASRTRSA